MTAYPEHEKMAKISDKSQAIGEFMEWLGAEKNIHLADASDFREDGFPVAPIQDLLAEFFDIDLKVIETEKRAMLDAMRAANA